MVAIYSAAPKANLTGFEDASTRTPLPEPEQLPMHLPHICAYMQRGPETTQLAGGSDLTQLFGADSFDYRKEYANHATVLMNRVNAQGNVVMAKRIIPSDAAKARIGVYLEYVEADIPQYKRNPDGTFLLDASGAKIPDGTTKEGYRIRWYIEKITVLGKAAITTGTLQGRDGAIAKRVPIMEYEASHFGKYGNNLGIALYAPTQSSPSPADDDLILDNEAYTYRIQFVERPDEKSSPKNVPTLGGEQAVEFTFKEGSINRATDQELFFEKIVVDSYQDLDSIGFAPVYAPMNGVNVYYDNIEMVLALLAEKERGASYDFLYGDHVLNFFTGKDFNDVPYRTVEVVGPAEDGLILEEGMYHYATGGSDGTMSLSAFDKAVGEYYANFEDSEEDLMDDALHPFSVIYDTGFTMETKKKLLTPMGLRKDVYVVLATQDITQRQNTASEDLSAAMALRAAARLYPESAEFGTATCRALIVGHSGNLVNSQYQGLLPLSVDVAGKCAKYMGASNGNMKSVEAVDESPNNQVGDFKNINCLYKGDRIRNRDWSAGLIWAQRYDRRSVFYPAWQTVYDNDTSILNSAINMMIGVEIEKICLRTWRDLTGNTKLTRKQFIERSNKLISERCANRFDGRVIIRPETFYTKADDARGYSWACRVNMYGNNMQTVGTFTVTARRRSDLEQ